MKLGVSVTDFSWPAPSSEIGPRLARIARRVDEAGFDSLWTMDHFFQIPILGAPPEDPMLEAYSTLAFMAAHTSRVQLGTLVTSVPYRHPGVLVKIVTTLDVLTGGRAVFGVGAGAPSTARALEHEAGGLGIPFSSLAERFEQLEEQLQIALQMWQGDETPYEGRHYRLKRPLNSPNSLRRPHPPILIGGSGERKTLRLVAQYADACNLFDIPGPRFHVDLPHKLQVLREHCEDVGRDYDEIEKTTATHVDLGEEPRAGVGALVDHLNELAEIGIDHAIVAGHDEEVLEAMAAVLPEVHAIPTRAAVLDR
jgi:F420-dependent oxidoreductase-like protein